MNLLFTLAHWHALAKLRQHTDLSLAVLESVTNKLGQLMRKFQEETAVYDTRELKREATARLRRTVDVASAVPKLAAKDTAGATEPSNDSRAAANSANSSSAPVPEKSVSKPKKAAGRLRRALNLNTYKDHSLGDYVETIRQYGTVDSYSTELVNNWSTSLLLNIAYSSPLDRIRAPFPKIAISEDKPQGL